MEGGRSPQQTCMRTVAVLASGEDADRWRCIGAAQGLTDDQDIAVFLITLYSLSFLLYYA